jgi:hypothetical protein
VTYAKRDIERLSDEALLKCLLERLRAGIDDLLRRGIRPSKIRRWLWGETGGPNAITGGLQYLAGEIYLERAVAAIAAAKKGRPS